MTYQELLDVCRRLEPYKPPLSDAWLASDGDAIKMLLDQQTRFVFPERTRISETTVKVAEPAPPPGPRKPTPALPAESWNSRAFDPDAAHAATVALCRSA